MITLNIKTLKPIITLYSNYNESTDSPAITGVSKIINRKMLEAISP